MRKLGIGILLTLLASTPVCGQLNVRSDLASLSVPDDQPLLIPSPPPTRAGVGRLFLGGVAGLGVAILGTHLAYQAGGGGRLCGDDSCGLAAGATALIVLEPILVPAGVHLANRRRGSFAATFFGSLLSGAALLYIGNALDLSEEFVYAGAAAQIAAAVIMERVGENERNHP